MLLALVLSAALSTATGSPSSNASATTVLPPPRPNLLLVDLRTQYPPGAIVPGMDIAYPNWTGNKTKIDPTGYDGVRIIGHGVDKTFIEGIETTFSIGDDAGIVEIYNATIICAKYNAIRFGSERGTWVTGPTGTETWIEKRKTHNPKNLLRLRNVRFVTRPPGPNRQTSTIWVVHSINVDHDWDRVDVDCPYSAEHALYAHGVARYGIRWRNVHVNAIGAEGLKVATRPFEAFFVPNAELIVEDSSFREWYQPWSWRGGVGISLQGSGLRRIAVHRSLFFGRDAVGTYAPAAKCIALSDGLSTIRSALNNSGRYYDMNGVPGGPAPANGHVWIDRCGFMGYGQDLIWTGTTYPDYTTSIGLPRHAIAASFTMTGCAAYGNDWNGLPASIHLREVEGDRIVVRRSNTPRIRRGAASVGIDTTNEAIVYTDIPTSGPVSQGVN